MKLHCLPHKTRLAAVIVASLGIAFTLRPALAGVKIAPFKTVPPRRTAPVPVRKVDFQQSSADAQSLVRRALTIRTLRAQGQLLPALRTESEHIARMASGIPSGDYRRALLQRSLAPIAIFDRAYDADNSASNGRGEWPIMSPVVAGGQKLTRTLDVFNNTPTAQNLKIRIEPVLNPLARRLAAQKLPAIIKSVALPANGHTSLTVSIPVPTVQVNTELGVIRTILQNGKAAFQEGELLVVLPANGQGTQVSFLGRDEATKGDWADKAGQFRYGKLGFLVPVKGGRLVHFEPGIEILRGSAPSRVVIPGKVTDTPLSGEDRDAMTLFTSGNTLGDLRLPIHYGTDQREATAFSGVGLHPLDIRVESSDRQPHELSLYLLDFKREKQMVDIDVFDAQGHRIDSRRTENLGEGVYLRYRFEGDVIVRLVPLTGAPATLSGVFVDPVKSTDNP